MKKFMALILALAMLFALAACGQSAPASSAAPAADKVFNVGVCQLVQHPALDAATQGFCDKLTELLGDKVNITVQNGGPAAPSSQASSSPTRSTSSWPTPRPR